MSSTSSTPSTSAMYNINNKFPLLFSSSSESNTSATSLSSLDDVLPQLTIKSFPMMANIKKEVAEDAAEVTLDKNTTTTWDLHVTNMEEEEEGITALASLAALSTAKQACQTPTTSTDSIPSLIPESSTDKDDNNHPGDGWQPCDDEDFFIPHAHLFNEDEPFNTWVNQAVIDLGDPSLLAVIEAYQGWEKEVCIMEEKITLLQEQLKEHKKKSRECL
ncbi:hypothetical protein BJV74DRAFT_891648 [Russula compacta]|nr:hypothetical protein BJV74DRAFT_891648 [Russula compacta]